LQSPPISSASMYLHGLRLLSVLFLAAGSVEDDLSCLTPVSASFFFGCNGLRNRSQCLRSRDGRIAQEWWGLKIAGEPCIWCGGRPCTTLGDALCEPADFMLRGQSFGAWEYGVSPSSLERATCPTPKRATITAPTKQQHAEIDSKCLIPFVSPTNSHAGCNAITNRTLCLTSRDGRAASEWIGIHISNEPCVWCGGVPCTNRGDALCEPNDFMLKGQILGIWTSGVSVSSLEHAVCRMPTVATTLQSSVAQTTKTITSATAAPMSTSPTLTPTAVRAGRLSNGAVGIGNSGGADGQSGSTENGSSGSGSGGVDTGSIASAVINDSSDGSDTSDSSNLPLWTRLLIPVLTVLFLLVMCILLHSEIRLPKKRHRRAGKAHNTERTAVPSVEPLVTAPAISTVFMQQTYTRQAAYGERHALAPPPVHFALPTYMQP